MAEYFGGNQLELSVVDYEISAFGKEGVSQDSLLPRSFLMLASFSMGPQGRV